MPIRATRLDAARSVTRSVRVEIGREIRMARVSAGVSQREAGARVAISHAQLGRIERAELREVTVDQLSRACSAVGLRLIVRAVPDADPAVDAGQLALLGRFRSVLPPGFHVRTEVPLPLRGDRRSWDGVVRLRGVEVAIEAETRLRDVQAVDRRCALKMRDGGVDRLILVLSDTPHNRRMLEAHREAIRETFPLDGREVLRSLRAGLAPGANGIVVL
jgi:transcriptional regulator with XRE-family HTH domain